MIANVVSLFWGTKYSLDYVNVLYNMVKRNLTIPFNFYCMTDDFNINFNKQITLLPIPKPVMNGWWNKLHLFNPNLGLEGNVLFLDLDIVILNNINEFFTIGKDEDFYVMRDFAQPNTINSSVLRFNVEHHSHIWDRYLEDKTRFDTYHSDQSVINLTMLKSPQTKFFPDQWTYSYKWPTRGNTQQYNSSRPQSYTFKRNAKISIFHGNPDPHIAMQHESGKWIKNYWK